MARYTLTPCHIDVDVFGWELKAVDGPYLNECHESFSESTERDLAKAKTWANKVIDHRHVWTEVTEERGSSTFVHYEAGKPDEGNDDDRVVWS